MFPRITVLMSIYNCADTLRDAIDSLYNQTYKNFKLVLCDDGSSDDTYQIAKEYASKYNNITLLKNDINLRLAASLNKCLEYADTEYIARMDGDDISLPTRFEKEIAFLDDNQNFSIVSCAMIHFDEDGDWGESKPNSFPDKYTFKKGTPHAHAACMVRTSVIKEVSGYTVSKYLVRGQDYYLWYKIYKIGYKGHNISEPLYKMRDDKNALHRRTFINRYKSFVIRVEVLNGLNIPFSFFYALPTLLKGFVPRALMNKVRRFRMISK